MLCWNLYVLLYCLLLWVIISNEVYLPKLSNTKQLAQRLRALDDMCVDNALNMEWWSYSVCFGKSVYQYHFDLQTHARVSSHFLGDFVAEESGPDHHIYRDQSSSCFQDEAHPRVNRYTEINLECCNDGSSLAGQNRVLAHSEGHPNSRFNSLEIDFKAPNAYIASIKEPQPCSYYITVCTNLICMKDAKRIPSTGSSAGTEESLQSNEKPITYSIPTPKEQQELLQRTYDMFYHGYHAYMNHAYPAPELKPVSCTGGTFDLVKVPLVTLVDTLDTLVIIGDFAEFRRAVNMVKRDLPDFNLDVNVSVFEISIRMLGGLLAAHTMAIDPIHSIYAPGEYDNCLLTLAVDLGERLYPAFDTKTGIPIGTVNLRYGVPLGETKIASTAGAGSLLVEFEVLSYLSGDLKYGEVAYKATQALYDRRSDIGLVGKHINTETGHWHESLSGIGSNSDSFYEYLLKSYFLFGKKELYRMFTDTYVAIKRFVEVDHWFTEVDMFSGKMQRKRVENLDAFWPGLESVLGFIQPGTNQLNSFYSVWKDFGLLPEEFDYTQWQMGNGVLSTFYPLRPELIESTYHHYRTTGDRSWLLAAKMILESLEKYAKTDCGYASVLNPMTLELHDSMSSFFLSETCKYLILLFDEDNFIHSRPFVFSTEAHPFDALQLHFNDKRPKNFTQHVIPIIEAALMLDSRFGLEEESVHKSTVSPPVPTAVAVVDSNSLESKLFNMLFKRKGPQNPIPNGESADLSKVIVQGGNKKLKEHTAKAVRDALKKQLSEVRIVKPTPSTSAGDRKSSELLPLKCHRRLWWDFPTSYDSTFNEQQNKQLRELQTAQNINSAVNKSKKKGKFAEPPPVLTPIVNAQTKLLNRLESISESFWLGRQRTSLEGHHNMEKALKGHLIEEDFKRNRATIRSHNYRPNTCHPSEQPKPTELAAGGLPILKTVKVSLGALGDFTVKVFTDGFIVHNKMTAHTIEISNVGKKIVLVREHKMLGDVKKHFAAANGGVVSRTVMGSLEDSLISTCRVDATMRIINSSTSQVLSNDLLLDRPCSLANFGPRKSSSFSSALVIPHYGGGKMCKSQQQHRMSENKRWWQWTKIGSDHSGLDNDRSYHDRVILARRGDCLFEEKAVAAQIEGAKALIVQNTDDLLFVMAGKKDIEISADPESDEDSTAEKMLSKSSTSLQGKVVSSSASKLSAPLLVQPIQSAPPSVDPTQSEDEEDDDNEEEIEDVRIPTVMVTKSDGDQLEMLLRDSERKMDSSSDISQSVSVQLNVAIEHMLFSRSGAWGAFLNSVAGSEDWQLFLLNQKDMTSSQLIPAVDIFTPNLQPISTSITLMANPVEAYLQHIRRRCPNQIIVSGSGRVIKLKK